MHGKGVHVGFFLCVINYYLDTERSILLLQVYVDGQIGREIIISLIWTMKLLQVDTYKGSMLFIKIGVALIYRRASS